jgi:hypothetical protein
METPGPNVDPPNTIISFVDGSRTAECSARLIGPAGAHDAGPSLAAGVPVSEAVGVDIGVVVGDRIGVSAWRRILRAPLSPEFEPK